MSLTIYPILLLGGAKRVSIVRKIAEAFRSRGFEPKFYSYETSKIVPIACMAEIILGLRWCEPKIYNGLKEIVEEKGIRMIVPFVDEAVGVAARFIERYPELEVFVPCSSSSLCDIMFDKIEADKLFHELGFPVPKKLDRTNPEYPLIAKPRRGSASKGLVIIENEEDLNKILSPENYLIQECILSKDEISVDCYVSVRTGEILTISPRVRLETLGGEAVRSRTFKYPGLESLCRSIIERTGLRGALTIQFIIDLSANSEFGLKHLIMEINPRLGGGVVCSIGAGADIPGQIADDALNRPCVRSEAKSDVEMCRYFEEVIFHI